MIVKIVTGILCFIFGAAMLVFAVWFTQSEFIQEDNARAQWEGRK